MCKFLPLDRPDSLAGHFAGVPVAAGGNRLLAELVADGDASPPQRAVIDYLAYRLPAYCIPDRIRFVGQIPRTASGKIRRT